MPAASENSETPLPKNSQRCTVIMTPTSANSAELRSLIYEQREAGHDIQVRVAWEHGQGVEFCQEAVASGSDFIIAAGGDGTLHQVVNALAALPTDQAAQCLVAVMPFGTGNDFARSLTMPLADFPRCWTQIWNSETVIEGDVMLTKSEDPETFAGSKEQKYTVNVASFGHPALFTANAKRESKDLLGGLAYFLQGLNQARSMTPFEVDVKADNFKYQGEVLAVIIANGKFAGGGWRVAPRADLQSRKINGLIIPNQPLDSMIAWVTEAMTAPSDTQNLSGLMRFETTEVTIQSNTKLPVNLDGELHHTENMTLKVAPTKLNFVFPAKSAPAQSAPPASDAAC